MFGNVILVKESLKADMKLNSDPGSIFICRVPWTPNTIAAHLIHANIFCRHSTLRTFHHICSPVHISAGGVDV